MIGEWTNQIHRGDVVDTLREMPESSVHMVMTSPPYWQQRDYGAEGQIGLEESLPEYIETLVSVGEEIRRVLRPDGNWWLNLGDTYNSNPGWGSQSEAVGGHDAGTGDRSANVKRKNKLLVPHRVAIALQESGWVVRSDGVWSKPNGMPDSAKDRLREDKEFLFHLTPEPLYWFDLDSVRVPHADSSLERSGRHDHQTRGHPTSEQTLDPEKFCHPNGANPGDIREIPVGNFPEAHFAVYPERLCELPIKSSCPPKVCPECGTPWDRDSEVLEREIAGGVSRVPEDERGYADRQGQSQNDREGLTQPTERRLGEWEQQCECDTTEAVPGIVLDPFAGAGTTCRVAKDLGRRFVGIELNADYLALAQKRVGVTVDEPERLLEDGQVPLSADGGFVEVADVGGADE